MNNQKVELKVYMESQVISGFLALPVDDRLSDFVNSPIAFFKLTDADIHRQNGERSLASEIYVNREAIQMIAADDVDAAKGIFNKKKCYPYVKKSSTKVVMHTPSLELNGSLYTSTAESIDQLLAKDVPFLPCTGVKIHDVQKNTISDVGFVALNRKQIQFLQADQ